MVRKTWKACSADWNSNLSFTFSMALDFFFKFYFIFKLYKIVLVLPNSFLICSIGEYLFLQDYYKLEMMSKTTNLVPGTVHYHLLFGRQMITIIPSIWASLVAQW